MGRKRAPGSLGIASFVHKLTTDSTTPIPPSLSVPAPPIPQASTPVAPPDLIPCARPFDSDAIVTDEPPKKRRRTEPGLLGPKYETIDATGMVPHYQDASEVPQHLQKYFAQRTRFFSLYDQGCLLDEEGWYSVTPEKIADQIAERCRCGTILDAFCGVGGNAIAFAKTCERVIALDTSPLRLALARHNAAIYGVEDRIEFILCDYLSFARSYKTISKTSTSRDIDVVFLSPPWGGPEYLSLSPIKPTSTSTGPDDNYFSTSAAPAKNESGYYSLDYILPIPGAQLFHLSRSITQNIAYYLPRNVDVEEVGRLVSSPPLGGMPALGPESADLSQDTRSHEGETGVEKVEIEEEWMGNKLKAVTCYFGGLVAGQESSF